MTKNSNQRGSCLKARKRVWNENCHQDAINLCLHRPCSRQAPRGKIESARTHSVVIKQFDSFSLLKCLFLVRNWHCWSRKAFPRKMTPKAEKKNCENGRFLTPLTSMKSCTVDRGCTPALKDATKLAVFFRFFSSLSFDILIKSRVQRWSSDFQSLFRVKIRKMAQGSNDLSTLPLTCQKVSNL